MNENNTQQGGQNPQDPNINPKKEFDPNMDQGAQPGNQPGQLPSEQPSAQPQGAQPIERNINQPQPDQHVSPSGGAQPSAQPDIQPPTNQGAVPQQPSSQPTGGQPTSQSGGAGPSEGVPPPPKPEDQVGIRTMSDDVSSVESSGGSVGEPKTFRPKDLLNNEPSFKPPGSQQPDQQEQQGKQNEQKTKKNRAKLLILSAIGILLFAGIAVAGFIYIPQFLQGTDPIPPVTVVEPSIGFSVEPTSIQSGESAILIWDTANATSVFIEGVGEVELSGSLDVTPTETTSYRLVASNEDAETESLVVVEVIQAEDDFEHTSLFPQDAGVSGISLAMTSVSIDEFNNLVNERMETESGTVLAEILPNLNGSAINSYNLFTPFFPALSEDYMRTTIAEDYTAFVYKDNNGVWPGFMVEINADIDEGPVDFSDLSSAIKQNPQIFYVSSPGTPSNDGFRDGAMLSDNMTSIEFLAYSEAGASFNIATLEIENRTHLLWSTSFDGIKDAVSALGF